ncbi:DUF2163 domain-containing protein [Roseobacter sp. YSTF-M11]|uniref:DUF2163 domain-containing protein n=1 Tax=Roseobacter insulae TaxID=2859783 RepID=A0A9X1FYV8_9RHOB|nr:DUF2163 domain-containing protein [Roseobacter insulae]MBW4709570.1 DUF2163 domain-containing protein [Roseobacter insulae]
MTAYDDALGTGNTSLCRCFLLTRLDGVVMGFTDHDRDLSFDGVTFLASAALTASDAASALGMAADEMEASGALSADAITESDLAAGLFDGAAVQVFDVDWSDTSVRRLLGRYTIGQVERGSVAFRTELRSLSAGLTRKTGRIHSVLCDARIGDARCGLNLSSPAFSAAATVDSLDALHFVVSDLGNFSADAFDRGRVNWTSGPKAGTSSDIRVARVAGGRLRVSLWRDPSSGIEIGDTATLTVGCNKTAETCRLRFGNLDNFRGFPDMPGETFAAEYARTGDPSQDGGSRS